MSNLTLALGYVIVVLHEFWHGKDLIPVGELFEVSRADRNKFVGAQVARDATSMEIAAFRGEEPAEEVPPDASEAIAALAVAQTQLATLERQNGELQAQIQELTQRNAELSKEVDELDTELEQQKDVAAALQKSLDAATAAKKTAKGAA